MHHVFPRSAFDSLSAEGITRAWDGLGGSHTFVTYPPLDALQPLSSNAVLGRFPDVREFSLYVHLPFCEMTCPFCPYERTVVSNSGGLEAYLAALETEIHDVGKHLRNSGVRSLYLGGGTATVLSEEQLRALFGWLTREFGFSSSTFVCVETSPNALIQNPSKGHLLQELGVKRVSVGVQTLSKAALQSEGRTHGPEETLQMLESLIRQIPVVNVDLMQDMPGQTDEDLENDAEQIARLPVAQITWYVERLRKSQGKYPDSYRSVERRLWLRDKMKSLSYPARPGGRFIRPGFEDDVFKSVRCGLNAHLVGLGASAYGHVPGYFYRNTINTEAYVKRVMSGSSPIAAGTALRAVDVYAAELASGIRWGASLNPSTALNGYVSQARQRLETLMRHDLVRYSSETNKYQITVDGPGWAYEEEICSLFVPQDLVDRIRAKNLSWWFDEPRVRL
jgi:coproporphyrinogen III oxidase-like Fe-S oxidoreductase